MLKLNFSKPLIKNTFLFLFLNINLFLLVPLGNFTLTACSTTEPPDIKPPVEPDSTTQNFTFETFEFGDGYESNELNDVWVFDENNIWAVGYVRETISNNLSVNIIRWNGNNWFGFGPQFNSSGIYGIWAIDSSNIFFAVGAVVQFKNRAFKEFDLSNLGFTQGQGVHKLWGSSENNIWGVGPNGTIVHFDGNAWSKIDFDQQWSFTAISGNAQNGIAYTIGRNTNFNPIIVKLTGNLPEIIYQSNQQITALKSYSVLYLNEALFLAGSDLINTLLWKYDITNNNIDSLYSLEATTAIVKTTGEKETDLYYWGRDYNSGKMFHFNGKKYKEFDLPRASITAGGAYTRGNISAVVGYAENKGYVTLVKRVPY